MRCVRRAGGKVQEEGLARCNLLGVGNEADGLVHQILRQVVTLFRCFLGFDAVVIVDQLRVVLMRIPTEKTIKALETPS